MKTLVSAKVHQEMVWAVIALREPSSWESAIYLTMQ